MSDLEKRAELLKEKILKAGKMWANDPTSRPKGLRVEQGADFRRGPADPERAWVAAAIQELAGGWDVNIMDFVGGGFDVIILQYRGGQD